MYLLRRSHTRRPPMSHSAHHQDDISETPLVSNGFLVRATAVVALLAALTLVISIGGRWLGARVSLAGNTDSKAPVTITIGRDTLRLPENVLRFPSQRRDGLLERADLYLTWPEMQGYANEHRARFDDVSQSAGLIFLQISQGTMSRDMSGRFEPIYSHLLDGDPVPYQNGMILHRLRADAGYADEVLLTAPRKDGSEYVVRCVLPATPALQSSGDCQRDIRIGNDLSVLYRFSSRHLPDWDHIDAAIRQFVETRLVSRSATGR
ncbi:hypothetical protein QTL95_19670 [Rhizobium sp. S152]|uniref:hypothetical protein n=1 Tax=Rhizobium sp. S152 TaxID=3055038 RepID=UPI0025A9D66D|nr:hypothetical protein [Rhizobium sp. S152]MDM9628115.1 hypothetical protein [Rhizobium sp. S152]